MRKKYLLVTFFHQNSSCIKIVAHLLEVLVSIKTSEKIQVKLSKIIFSVCIRTINNVNTKFL